MSRTFRNKKRNLLLGSGIGIALFSVLFFSPLGVELLRLGIETASSEAVTITASSGRLFDTFTFTGIKIGEQADGATLKTLQVHWEPRALLRGEVRIKEILADGFYLKEEDINKNKSKIETKQSAYFYAPFLQIILDKFLLTNFFYDRGIDSDGDPNTSFIFDSIELSVIADKEGIHLHGLEADGADMALSLAGEMTIGESPQIELGGTFRFAGFSFHSMQGKLSLVGAVDEPEISLELIYPETLKVEGKFYDFTGNPSWQAQLLAQDFDLSLWIEDCPQIIVHKGEAAMKGDLAHYEGHALFHGSWGFYDNFALEGDLWGNEDFINFITLALRRQQSIIEAESGWISWQDFFDLKGTIIAKNIDTAFFASDIKGNINGKFYTEAGFVGDNFKGIFEDIDLHGTLYSQPFSLTGNLTLHNSRLITESLRLTSGKVAGVADIRSGYIDWGKEGGWLANISLRQFDPISVFPQYGGRIDGEIESNGRFADEKNPLFASIQFRDIAGEVRGKKLQASGALTYHNTFLQSEGFSLQLGNTTLDIAEARFAAATDTEKKEERKIALRMDFHSPALEEILPEGKGSITCNADIHGTEFHPVGSIQLRADKLSWQNFFLQKAKGVFQLREKSQKNSYGEIELNELRYADTSFQQFALQATGQAEKHRLHLSIDKGSVAGKSFSTAITVDGSLGFSPWIWQGKLSQGNIDFQQYGSWKQQGEAVFQLQNRACLAENIAFRSNLASISTSISASAPSVDKENGWQWQSQAQIAKMELKQWQDVLHLPVDIAGPFSAQLSVNGENFLPVSGEFSAVFPHTVVAMEDLFSQGEAIEFTDGSIQGRLENGLLHMNGGFKEKRGGNLQYRLAMGEEGNLFSDTAPLVGEILCKNLDIDVLGNFFSYGQPFGNLQAELFVEGVLSAPKLSGRVALDGGVGLLSQGISLKNIEVNLNADSAKTYLSGRASSGKGFVTIDGQLNYSGNTFLADFFIGGDNFLAVDLPEYSFVVDPDMQFTGDLQKGRLSGNVSVVSGIIAPNYLPDTISVSDDVVLVRKGERAVSGWQLSMDMGVDLGKDVAIDGYGVSGKLGGVIQVKMEPEEPLSGTGTLTLNQGKFAMYGRSLDITRGNIIFSGGPMDNPGVDIRAQKTMSSKRTLKEGYTVGVDVSGLVQNLHYNLFSIPAMSQTEILSYMILGHSLAGTNAGDESILTAAMEALEVKGGSALLGEFGKILSFDDVHLEGSVQKKDVSLVVGKRLTKDIYVGYDINMYSQRGEFWVRYDLGKGFSVQTFSSSQSTGADLQFSFDR